MSMAASRCRCECAGNPLSRGADGGIRARGRAGKPRLAAGIWRRYLQCRDFSSAAGGKVGYLTALGEDRFGASLEALWAREGVDTSGIVKKAEAPTGIYFVDPDPAGRFFTYYRKGSAASLFGPEDLPVEMIRAAKVLHLSSITLAVSAPLRAAAFKAMDIAHAAGCNVSVDTNLRLGLWPLEEAKRVTHKAIGLARTVVTSLDDCITLMGLDTSDAVIDAI